MENNLKMDERQKVAELLEHPLIQFKVDQEVKLKKDFEFMCGGKSIAGKVDSIEIDRNGIWYNILYMPEDDLFTFKSTKLLDGFLEDA